MTNYQNGDLAWIIQEYQHGDNTKQRYLYVLPCTIVATKPDEVKPYEIVYECKVVGTERKWTNLLYKTKEQADEEVHQRVSK